MNHKTCGRFRAHRIGGRSRIELLDQDAGRIVRAQIEAIRDDDLVDLEHLLRFLHLEAERDVR